MFKRILVPLDGSDLAERALQPALALARPDGTELLLVRAPEFAYGVVPSPWTPARLDPDLFPDYTENLSREYLSELQARLTRPELAIQTEVRLGEPAQVIVEAAAARAADLIVMSSHGHSGMTRWLLGSVAERCCAPRPAQC
jgi:nucleotide-binding universal stress UspA family protein